MLFFWGLSDLPGLEILAYVLFPGAFAADLLLPGGMHGDWSVLILAITLMMNGCLLGFPLLWLWRYFSRRFDRDSEAQS